MTKRCDPSRRSARHCSALTSRRRRGGAHAGARRARHGQPGAGAGRAGRARGGRAAGRAARRAGVRDRDRRPGGAAEPARDAPWPRRRPVAGAQRAPRHRRRRRHGRPVLAAHRGRPDVRPRHVRHEGGRGGDGRRRRARGRARATTATSSSRWWPTRSTAASAPPPCSTTWPGRLPDACIVGEPTWLDVIVAHRGFAAIEVEIRGRAAHSSRPARGRQRRHAASGGCWGRSRRATASSQPATRTRTPATAR